MTKPHSHANPAFDRDIKKMSKLLGEMEGAVKYQLVAVSEAFARLDLAQSRKICKNDKTINNIRQELEEQTILLLARHQPMADDLRHITGAFKASIEYERMGDYVKHFAKSVGKFAAHHESLEVFPALAEMETAVRKMYDDFLAAKKDDNTDAACKVWLSDQKLTICATPLCKRRLSIKSAETATPIAWFTPCRWPKIWSASAIK